MTTFLAWLIANIKVPFYTIIILLFEILLFTGAIPCDEEKIITAAIMAVFCLFVIDWGKAKNSNFIQKASRKLAV